MRFNNTFQLTKNRQGDRKVALSANGDDNLALIEVKDLALAYEGNVVASDINFTVNEGDYLCIIGENGSGKTTLMKALLGLMKIYSGEIIFGDGLTATEIGYMPQRTDIQKDFPATCYEVVLSGTLGNKKFKPFYSKEDKKKAAENMRILGIENLKKKSFQDLSGGQQQRVLLARALCATKKIILLDEPVTGLDPIVTAEMYDIINRLNKEHGIAVIMISHDIAGALECASHILHLHHKQLFFGTKDEYLLNQAAKDFIGGENK